MSDRYLSWLSQLAERDQYALALFCIALALASLLSITWKQFAFNRIIVSVLTGGIYVACLVVALSPFVAVLRGGR